MELSIQWRNWHPSKPIAPSLTLSLRLLMGFAIVTIAVRTLTVMTMAIPPNPFSGFVDISPGQSQDALKARGFLCSPSYYNSTSCLLWPESGVFSNVEVTVYGGNIHQISFIVRDTSLRVGDLVRLWGRPRFQGNNYLAGFVWANSGITASAQEYDPAYSLFLPIWRISFVSGRKT